MKYVTTLSHYITMRHYLKINHKLGGDEWFRCENGGVTIHRDINGARNIMDWDRAGLQEVHRA